MSALLYFFHDLIGCFLQFSLPSPSPAGHILPSVWLMPPVSPPVTRSLLGFSSPLGLFLQVAKSCWAKVGGERKSLTPLHLPFKGKKLPEDPGADTVDFPKRTTPAKGMLLE